MTWGSHFLLPEGVGVGVGVGVGIGDDPPSFKNNSTSAFLLVTNPFNFYPLAYTYNFIVDGILDLLNFPLLTNPSILPIL